ncbi:EAL domain-containing protein [uncultured Paraglaciecola sp.]|uniref:two-component system response regulator n=1 Tax=uncultured Paraglaciecola sp. TaxID=1765024 RepID=UPI0025E42B06|nr:EAL domain-containing protein [uncultured Paraglaciecola sp.]
MKTDSVTKKKVLICDDDRTHLLILNETLKAQGYEVEQAENGEVAFETYCRFLPDIVLLDVKMPILNGYEVCTKIRATNTGQYIPILMITGSDDYESIEKAFEVGSTDFLSKPIKWSLIQHRIKYMLRSHAYQKRLKTREKELQYLAYYDPLTKLPNRQFFTEQLAKSIAQSARRNTTMAVMFIDLDSFKRINDTLGHRYGDVVLKEVASRLTAELRASDVITRNSEGVSESQVARLGGDEFTVLLSDCGDSDKVTQIAKRIISAIPKPIVVEHYSLVVTASIGISIYPIDGTNAEDLIKYADMAKHEAKESGKSCYRLHSKELHERSLNRLKLEEYMREALKQDMFELYYQPQVNSITGKVEGAEALLRLHHSTLGIISPIEFIPIAEDTGLIVEIGYWVIRRACEQLVKWQNSEMASVSISVNVSVKQINKPKFVSTLQGMIKNTGANPALLEIELTESIIMTNPEENISKLQEIKTLGVKLSIDDFGTGYSSLSYLKKFPLDILKIDRSFVIGLTQETTSDDAVIISAISAMAKALRLNIVVEGIETSEQLNCTNTLCGGENTLIQGYFYSKPLPIDSLVDYVHSNFKYLSH